MHVIRNGTIYTMGPEGIIQADLLADDSGKIAAIGNDLGSVDAETTDAAGKCVVPGFVDPHSHIGGFGMNEGDDDLNELTAPLTPELDAYYGVDPTSRDFQIALEHGITTSCITPGSGNVVCGWAIAMKSGSSDCASRLVKRPVALKCAMGINPKGVYSKKFLMPMSRMGIAFLLQDYLRRVRDYMKKKADANGDAAKMPPYDLGLEHGIPVLEKKIPIKVHSYMHDMMTVLEIARQYDILCTLDHAQGASDYYDELTDPHIQGVIYGPICSGLFPGEGGKIDFECCKGLDDRGVTVAVMTDGPVTRPGLLLTEVGEAVRHGMDPIRALGMITCNSAKIIQCDERVGSLEKGKDADILIYSGMPALDISAVLEKVLIDGKVAFDQDKVMHA